MTEQTFHKYPKIFALGHEENAEIFNNPDDLIWVEEKIDGANARFMIKDGRIIFGSHNCSIGDDTQEIGGNWKRYTEFVKSKKNLLANIKGNYIFYGEAAIKHSINYDWDKMTPFVGFDIFDLDTNKFISPSIASKMYEDMEFTFVPILNLELNILTAKTANEFIKDLNDSKVPQSKFYAGQCEGIIFKNYYSTPQIFAKYVTTKFKEVNREVFGMSKRQARATNESSDIFIATYCTNPRIDKKIFELINEGEVLDLKLMSKLPKAVLEDIYAENWHEILTSNMNLDLKDIRTKVPKRCLQVLKQVMINNQLNKGV